MPKNILKDQIYPNSPEIVRKNCIQNVPNDLNAQIKLSGSISSKKPLQDALNILKGRNISRYIKVRLHLLSIRTIHDHREQYKTTQSYTTLSMFTKLLPLLVSWFEYDMSQNLQYPK